MSLKTVCMVYCDRCGVYRADETSEAFLSFLIDVGGDPMLVGSKLHVDLCPPCQGRTLVDLVGGLLPTQGKLLAKSLEGHRKAAKSPVLERHE